MKKIAFILAGLTLAGCSDAQTAERALRNSGLKDIQTTGYRFFGCDDNDTFHTGFAATNANGQRVTGTVCSGWLKGATVRFD